MAAPLTPRASGEVVDPVAESDEPCGWECGEPLALHSLTEGAWNGCVYGWDAWIFGNHPDGQEQE